MHTYATYSDEQLVALLHQSDEQAFTELYRRYWKRVFTVAANRLDDLYSAEEIVQDLFADLWRRREALRVKGLFITYLSAALKYKVIDTRLKKTRLKNNQQQLQPHEAHNEVEDAVRFGELRERLEHLVALLPEKCRLVFHLSREEGFSHHEIASELRISEKTVEYHLSKALKHLRTGLSQFFTFLF